MKKYHAIPVLIYAPVDVYPAPVDVYDAIKIPLDTESPDLMVFFAEDYMDGLVDIDPKESLLSACIGKVCVPF